MRRNAFLAFAAAVALGSPCVMAADAKTWDFSGRGKWAQVQQPSATQPVVNVTLDKAEQLLDAHRSEEALKTLLDWIKKPENRLAPDRDRGLYLLAEAYYQEDDRIVAFYHLDELMDYYPESRYFTTALQKQYQIADEFLKGHKRKLLGMKILPGDEEAIDMLFRIQERSPGSPLAERSLLRTADFYFATSQFDLAADAYAAYARAYPRSPESGRVRLQQALSSYAQFHGARFDATPLIDARTQFEDIKVRYPDLAKQANVQQFIDTINTTLARKLLLTADFYRRTDHPTASAYTLQTLLATYPKTKEAEQARTSLAGLPKWAVERAGRVGPSESKAQGPIGPPAPNNVPVTPALPHP